MNRTEEPMEIDERIGNLRRKIEGVDEKILGLLNERAEIVKEVGKAKVEINMDAYAPKREEEILQRLSQKNRGPFPQRAVSPVFREIISACRSLETALTVAYLGPPATHTQLASLKHFGSSVRAVSEESLQDVFEAVVKEKATFGVVPIENSIEGSVDRTLDLLIDFDVKIWAEVYLRVSHDLLSRTGRAEDIQKIYSHPQAFGQCREWLRKNLPHVPLIETVSTAKAAKLASEEASTAAIATSLAASLHGLKVIASQIEDHLQNYTRFLVLGRKISDRTGKDKTSILFSIPHVPGSLCRTLQILSERGINLTKIESRPIKGKSWEYLFFVDFEGHAEDPDVGDVMKKLSDNGLFMKVLGSYPRTASPE
jgi:chorismate mutase/prephenate dehydratase